MAQQRQRCVQVVGAMEYWSVKGKWHPRQKQKDKKGRKENSRIVYCRIYGKYFSVAPFSRSIRRRYRRVAVSDVGAEPYGLSPAAVSPVE